MAKTTQIRIYGRYAGMEQFARQPSAGADDVPVAVGDHYHLTSRQWPRLTLTADTTLWLPDLG